MAKKRQRLTGKVQRIIKPHHPALPEKAQIAIDGAEELYREIRVENKVADDHGATAKLKEGAEVDVIIETDSDPSLKRPA